MTYSRIHCPRIFLFPYPNFSTVLIYLHVAYMKKMRNACSICVRKLEGKRSLGKHQHRWDDNIKNRS
jgi:hypothetical protein